VALFMMFRGHYPEDVSYIFAPDVSMRCTERRGGKNIYGLVAKYTL